MQHAVPTSFGLQVAGWLDAVQRHQARLREMTARVLVLQFGGAAGTLAALGDRGLEVSGILADELRLTLPEMPWHAHRDRMAEVATAMALCAGTLGKIGRDIALQMQTEVGELSERFTDGSGGSSTMPQKRNPVSAGVAISAAVRVPGLTSTMLSAMVQEHERGLGGWHAEWDTLPQIIQLTAGSLHHLTKTLKSLESKPERMLENLKRSRGLIFAENAMMAVAKHVGRSAAHQIVTVASHRSAEERRHLGDILKEDLTVTKHLSAAEIDHLFDPLHYIGMAQRFIDRVLVAHEEFSRSRERG
jgi:3-carboxy-cis,cis-muconate cycloisomerase